MDSIIGVLNLTFPFTTALIFVVILRSFSKVNKVNLYQSILSFFSMVFCVFVILKVDNLYKTYEFAKSLQLKTVTSLVILFLIFLFMYFIVKLLLRLIFKIFYLKQFLVKKYNFSKILSFIFVLFRKSIFLIYLIVILTLVFNKLYFTGITKPIVNAGVIKSPLSETFTFIETIESSQKQINSFTSLFSTNLIKEKIQETKDLLRELETYENDFMDNIYPSLSSDDKLAISEKYKTQYNKEINYEGILYILIDENDYSSILNKPNYNEIKSILIKIPYLNKVLFKNLNVYNLYNYLDNNQQLIRWLQVNRTYIREINSDNNDILLIKQFYQDYNEIIQITDTSNKDILKSIKKNIDDFFDMQEWLLNVLGETLSIDEILKDSILTFLIDGNNLDLAIEQFNNDYKKGKFNNNFKEIYLFTNEYLKNYRIYSKMIEHNIDPKVRIGAAVIHKLDHSILYKDISFYYILTYINSKCLKTCNICNEDLLYDLVDMLLWGVFSEEYEGSFRISNKKLNELFNSIDNMDGYNKERIIKEIINLNDKLMFSNRSGIEESYFEENFYDNKIQYDVFKVLYRNEEYISDECFDKIQELIK